ncbi:MAG: bifunctional diaminohydroxyphosphoribosylaminopyrimidine deaminase/5-amino-6-(5-phosphoribosylamino)uracil reductase RibD, partial [Phycisphaerales bacterium]|nr:bifunctional diaminohydroxyphosphoribosylaminopyrimidine deaminase/5-amino-6-(5-phosphoribosylamino)uracil reductase RibD [Phycisphaerales bacterium]
MQQIAMVDKRFLDLAARAALRAAGHVEPNPMVGAVIVKEGKPIGIGHHLRFGGPHAEPLALADCASRGHDPRGGTLYVTLEPCSGYGKQPPCTLAVLGAGIKEVVFARADPNPLKAGGAAQLESLGVKSRLSPASPLASSLSDAFVTRLHHGRPLVIAKWAQTIDGRVATRAGDSKWISSSASRCAVHRLRARVDVVLTGSGTIIADDPMLTGRDIYLARRRAVRVIVDSTLRTPLESQIIRTALSIAEWPVWVYCAARVLESPEGLARAGALR